MLAVLTEALGALDLEKMSPAALADVLSSAACFATYHGRFAEAAGFLDQLDAVYQQDPHDANIRYRWADAKATYLYWGPPADQLEGDRLMAAAQQAMDETGQPEGVAAQAAEHPADSHPLRHRRPARSRPRRSGRDHQGSSLRRCCCRARDPGLGRRHCGHQR